MLFQEVFLKYTWSSHYRMVLLEISCNTKKWEASSGVNVGTCPSHVHLIWAAPQAGSGWTCLFSSQKNTSTEKETVSEAVEGKSPCLGTAYLQEQAKHCERHWSRAMLLLYWPSVPVPGERQIRIFFCQQALTKINLSIWPIMKEVSKTKVTSISRHE